MQLFQNICYLDLGKREAREAEVGVARKKALPAIEKCLLKFSIITDLSVVTMLPSLSAVGSWEEVLLFSIDFTVSQNFLEFVLQDANFCNQTSSTYQDTRARSIRKASSLTCFRAHLTLMRGGRLTADPLLTQAMRQ